MTMAHADYNCCAICDSKMEYAGGDAKTKETLCDNCQIITGLVTVHQITEGLNSMNYHVTLKWLHDVNYSPCYYDNPLDQYLIDRGLIVTGKPKENGAKWGKLLAPLPKEQVVKEQVILKSDEMYKIPETVTRVELISVGNGREYVNKECEKIELSLQDDNRTLKIFVTSR